MVELPFRGEESDRGVSPVIGVILMVAITVILAAVIASFVLGLGDQTNEVTPNVNFNGEFVDNSGDDEADNFTLSVDTTDGQGDIGDFALIDENGDDLNTSLGSLQLSAGSSETFTNDTLSLSGSAGDPIGVEEIRVVFRGDNEQIFDTFEVPDDL